MIAMFKAAAITVSNRPTTRCRGEDVMNFPTTGSILDVQCRMSLARSSSASQESLVDVAGGRKYNHSRGLRIIQFTLSANRISLDGITNFTHMSTTCELLIVPFSFVFRKYCSNN